MPVAVKAASCPHHYTAAALVTCIKTAEAVYLATWLKDLAVIVPLLTPAQRETLATKIEKGPAAPPAMKDDVNAK